MRPLAFLDPLPDRLRRFYLANWLALGVPVITLGLASALYPGAQLVGSFVVLAAAWLILLVGSLTVRRWGAGAAVVALTVACLVFSVGGVLITPFIAPLAVLAVLLPILLAFPYADRRSLSVMVVWVVVGSALVAALAEWRRATVDPLPTEVEVICLLGFMPLLVTVLTLEVRDLYLELTKQAADLHASRARVIGIATATRRDIERDLHDGAQQRLIGLTVQARLAQDAVLAGDLDAATRALDLLDAEAHAAVAEVRELAHGIYPPLLTERGLVPALKAAALRSTLPCTLLAEKVGRYPEEAESAVYFCITEALANVTKHSGADQATIQVRGVPELEFAVVDNGVGFDQREEEGGRGLVNMETRMSSLGGTLTVTTTPGSGTTVRGVLPGSALTEG